MNANELILNHPDPIAYLCGKFCLDHPEVPEKDVMFLAMNVRSVADAVRRPQRTHVKNWLFEYAAHGKTRLLAILGFYVYLRVGEKWALSFTRKRPY